MPLEGKIIEFLDTDGLHFGYVRKQERARLYVIDPRGRNLSVAGTRVVIVHRAVEETEFPSVAHRLSEMIEERRSEIDVELLWESVARNPREFEAAELALAYFGASTPERASAVFRALDDDPLFFKRRGSHFVPHTEEQVTAERLRRARHQERQEFRGRVSQLLDQLLRNPDLQIGPEFDPIVDRVHNWLRYRTGDEVGTILEQLTSVSKAKDAAYEILLRAGRIDPSADRFLVMAGVGDSFPPNVIEASERLLVYEPDSSRMDYSDLPAVAIDDEDTREVDDALTVLRSGRDLVVRIHIADVSVFAQKGDLLDCEAYNRSSTIYLPTTTITMFPERLSTNLASLQPGFVRPAVTLEVHFDERGNRLDYRMVLSSIRVAERLTYEEASRRIEQGDDALSTLHAIACHLLQARSSRGAMTFRRPELKIRVRDGRISVKRIDTNSLARVLVSEMMILANGLASDYAAVHGIPIIYRAQEPSREASPLEPPVDPLAFERLRKAFRRSRLSLTPAAHAGLGLDSYTQMSSPIRRYADLVTQRQFTATLKGHTPPYSRDELLEILGTAEAAELEIRSIEEKSTTYWLLEFLAREKVGQAMAATVVDQNGTVELTDYYLRGKVSGAKHLTPGATISVGIESIAPTYNEIRFRMAKNDQT